MLRKPYVAGQFYSSGSEALGREIESCFTSRLGPERSLSQARPGEAFSFKGGVAPHAGYVYSGFEAAHLYLRMYESGLPETVIILGPCHRAFSETAIGVFSGEGFETPFGACENNIKLASAIAARPPFKFDDRVHQFEHSLEVQVPFLQYIYSAAKKPLKIVALCVLDQGFATAGSIRRRAGDVEQDRRPATAIDGADIDADQDQDRLVRLHRISEGRQERNAHGRRQAGQGADHDADEGGPEHIDRS